MSKAVMIAIQPKWCELIASGKKTVEVRKTRPKLDAPFKCYIYCTKNKGVHDLLEIHSPDGKICKANGKVMGEFVCDGFIPYINGRPLSEYEKTKVAVEECACLNADDIRIYEPAGNPIGWHISDLQIYDTPKKFSAFLKPCPHGEDSSCFVCEKSGYAPDMHIDCFNTITRPPQSWCYVEDFVGGDGK